MQTNYDGRASQRLDSPLQRTELSRKGCAMVDLSKDVSIYASLWDLSNCYLVKFEGFSCCFA